MGISSRWASGSRSPPFGKPPAKPADAADDLVAELKRLKFQVVSTSEAANLVVVLTARNGTSELAGTNAAAIPIGNAILMPVRCNYAYTFTILVRLDP